MSFLNKPFKYRNDNVVFILIGLNVLVFLGEMFLTRLRIPVYLSIYPPAIYHGWIWQFVTYMFVHDPNSMSHIVFNMLALFIFGTRVEQYMGSREFLLYYMITGILAGVFSFIFYVITNTWLVFLMGASGAIFALQLAYAAIYPKSVMLIWGILPLPAPVMVLVFTAFSLVSMFTGIGGNVAHLTHLAGFAFGWLYFLVRFRINPWRAMFG